MQLNLGKLDTVVWRHANPNRKCYHDDEIGTQGMETAKQALRGPAPIRVLGNNKAEPRHQSEKTIGSYQSKLSSTDLSDKTTTVHSNSRLNN